MLPSALFTTLLLTFGAAFADASDPEPELGSAGNPIKTLGKQGVRDYIESLDCENGAIPEYRHESSSEVGPDSHKLEKYVLRCAADNIEMYVLYLDPGHDKTETRPAKGFTSWL